MPSFAPITVRQPQPHDIVDDPVSICGVGTGFEGVFSARVRDGNGAELAIDQHHGGWPRYLGQLSRDACPRRDPRHTKRHGGSLRVPAERDGRELNKVTVPVVFGRALIDPYHGFAEYTVVAGDTLSGIALHWYGDATQWPRIFAANTDEIADPNLIYPGQIFRIPQ